MTFIPPLVRIGFVVSATVYKRNKFIFILIPLPAAASWKTSQGPAKSIITAPSDSTNATGTSPWGGGFKGSADVLLASEPALAASWAIAENGIADTKPNAA